MTYRVKGAIIAGIALVSIISWPRPTEVTYFPYTSEGNQRFDFFKNVVGFHKVPPPSPHLRPSLLTKNRFKKFSSHKNGTYPGPAANLAWVGGV